MEFNKISCYGDYKKWLKKEYEYNNTKADINYYESLTDKMKKNLEESPVWNNLKTNLSNYGYQYYIATNGYQLFQTDDPKIDFEIKPYSSLINKSYRKNVTFNQQFPNVSENDLITPDNWYEKINDILRTVIVVTYLDGVKFLVEKIENYYRSNNIVCKSQFEAKEEGYYAAHVYFEHVFEVPTRSWGTNKIKSCIEIQITTQLQELIRGLLHKYYEEKRKESPPDSNWQWDFPSDEFYINYLGHTLHLIEGMIFEIRENQTKKEKI